MKSLLAKAYQHASTQINVPDDVAADIKRIAKELIQDEHLAGDGRVEVLHVTLKFGVQPDENVLRQAIAGYKSFNVALGKTVIFPEASTEATPVVIEVHGHEFGELHKTIANAMGTQPDDFPYTPHITVAYVEQKEAQHYAGSDAFVGIEFVADAVTLSMFDDDNQVDVPLVKAAAKPSIFYHATFAKNIPSIARQGLKPSEDPNWGGALGQESLGKVYFAKSPRNAMFYASTHFYQTLDADRRASIPVCLRIRVPRKTEISEPYTEYGYEVDERWAATGIPPKNIEIWWHGKWNPIQSVVKPEYDWENMDYSYSEDEGVYVDWEGEPVGETPIEAGTEAKQSFTPKTAAGEFIELSPEGVPPELYHGTPAENVASIREHGLWNEEFPDTYLSDDPDVAKRWGQDIVVVNTRGLKFYQKPVEEEPELYWITDEPIPPASIKRIIKVAASPAQVTPQIPEVAPQVPQGEQPEEEEVRRDEPATEEKPKPKRQKKQPKNKLLAPKQPKETKPKKPPVNTTNFKKWFGKSKVRDDDGKPLVVYHGTTHDFEAFDPRKAHVENYYGQGLYFTSSKTDVGENYATDTGGDITSRIENRAEQIMQGWEDRWDDVKGDLGFGDLEDFPDYSSDEHSDVYEKAEQEAKREIAGQSQGMTMPVYLSLQNPVIVKKNGGTKFQINFDEETKEESGNGVKLYEAMLRVAGGYYMDVDDLWAVVNNNGPEFNAWDFEKVIRDSDRVEDNEGNLANGNFIADVYQEMGFDGIIQYAYEAFGPKALGPGYGKTKGMKMEQDTKHYILWDPHKIKSAIGNPGKFDPKNPSITAAVLHDEAKQKTYYHGTDDEAAAQAIISGGIQPREITMPDKAKSRAMQAPVPDRVYMTDSMDYAAIYAMGGQSFGMGLGDQTRTNYTAEMWLRNHTKNGEYGYIFEISGADLAGDVMPDEDSIGEALSWLLGYQKSTRRLKELETQPERWQGEKEGLLNSMKIIKKQPITRAPQGIQDRLAYMAAYLTPGQRQRIDDAAVQSQVGKKLQKRLPEEVAKWLLDNGAHLAHQGQVFPCRCWRFSKKDALYTRDWKSLLQEVPLQQSVTAAVGDTYHQSVGWLLPDGSFQPLKKGESHREGAVRVGLSTDPQDMSEAFDKGAVRVSGNQFATLEFKAPTSSTLSLLLEFILNKRQNSKQITFDWFKPRRMEREFASLDEAVEWLDNPMVTASVTASAGDTSFYRGTPEPETDVLHRDHPVVFFADSPEGAENFGKYVQQYEVDLAKHKLADIATLEALYRKFNPKGSWAAEKDEILFYPEREWVDFLASKGFTGYRAYGYIALINPDWVTYVARWLDGRRVGAGATGVGDLGLARKVMHELMPVLGVQLPEPELKIVNSPRAGWLGRDTWRIGIQNGKPIWGDNTVIEIQKSIVNDENTLRRILAHELAHHADFLINGIEKAKKIHDVWSLKEFNREDGHGAPWKQYAQKFNAKYGADFVTAKSDESYVTEDIELKPFHILLERNYDGTLGYEVSSRLSPNQKRYLDRLAQRQGKEGEYQNRITMTNDRDWLNGPLIGSYRHARPKEPERQKKLEELWAKGQAPQPTGAAKEQDEILQKMRQVPWLNQRKSSLLNKTADGGDQVVWEYAQAMKDPKANANYRQKWSVVPAARLKKIWNDFAELGFVRDEKGMRMITGQVLDNVWKLQTNTILTGHTSESPSRYGSEILGQELPEDYFEQLDDFFTDERGSWRISDYGLDPLLALAYNLEDESNAEKQLVLVDQMLAVTHPRSDLASWFVEGGSSTLSQLFRGVEGVGEEILEKARKRGAVPRLQELEHGVSKDYDRVRWVYQQFLDSRVQSMSWQDFQKKFPRERNSPLFTEVRQNRPKITTEDMERWMDEFDAKAREYQNYEIEHGTYKDKATSFRDVEQLVLKINQSASAREIIGEDPMMTEFLSQIAQGSAQSGHPAGEATVGWLRVDFIDDDWLLVDEVQSDVINGVELGKRFLTEPTLESLMSKYKSETVKQKIRDMGATEQTFAMSKRNMVQRGYTVEKLDEMKQQLVNLFKDWADYGIASLIEIARRHGIKNVAIHTGESVAKRDPDLEADKAVMYYDSLAKSFGFRKQQVDVGDLKGEFWVRTAGSKNDISTLTFEIEDIAEGWVVAAWTPSRLPNPYSPTERPVGQAEVLVSDEVSGDGEPWVFDIGVEDDWRGTGLGQALYDRAIAEAKKRGYKELNSSTDQSPEAHAAWKRLSQRYQVREEKHPNGLEPYYSIKLAGTASDKTAAVGIDNWRSGGFIMPDGSVEYSKDVYDEHYLMAERLGLATERTSVFDNTAIVRQALNKGAIRFNTWASWRTGGKVVPSTNFQVGVLTSDAKARMRDYILEHPTEGAVIEWRGGDEEFASIDDCVEWLESSSKTAGKRDEAVTSMTVGTTDPNFPMPVLIRWEQGMRWRQVLKAVKSVVGEIAGRRVPWHEIHIWASFWDSQQAQQEGWEQEKRKGCVMYDILHDGSFVSAGKQTASALGAGLEPNEPELPWDGDGRIGDFPGREPGGKLSKIIKVKPEVLVPSEQPVAEYVEKLIHQFLTDEDQRSIPAAVVEDNGDGTYTVVDGHNRIEAAKQVGYKEIPIRIYTSPDDLASITADSHKVTPLDDTYYNNPESGEETNAYANIPERVRGDEAMPSLKTLAPQMFAKGSARTLKARLMALRPLMAQAAQEVYDAWDSGGYRTSEGGDVEFGEGGICDSIAREIGGIIAGKIRNVEVTDGGQDGDDHAWTIAYHGKEAYGIDIPHTLYEHGGGYSWTKVPGVTFSADDVEIFPVDADPSEFAKEGGAGGETPEGVEYRIEVLDSRKGELYCEAEAWLGGKRIGVVNFNEVEEDIPLDDTRYYREGEDEYGVKEWERIAEIPKKIWVTMVWVGRDYRRKGVATGMYEKIKREFPGEKITSSGTTPEGGKFREKLTERGVLARKNAAAGDLSALVSYLTMSPRENGEELARFLGNTFQEYLEEHDLLEQYAKLFDEDGYIEDYSTIPDKVLTDFLDEKAHLAQEWDPANAPTFLTVSYKGMVKNGWLVHFTDHPDAIAKEGFRYGMDRIDTLALTTYFKDDAKKFGGYNFALDAGKRNLEGLGKNYGKHCVLFRANGVKTLKTYPYGDEFEQIIFWGKDAKDIIPIYSNYDIWQVGEDADGNPLFDSYDLKEVIDWAIANKAKLVRKPKLKAHAALLQKRAGRPNFPPTFAEYAQKHGGVWKYIDQMGDAWNHYEETLIMLHDDETLTPRWDEMGEQDKKEELEKYAVGDMEERYGQRAYQYNNINFPVDIWREISLKDSKALKTQGIGVFWSWNEGNAEAHWGTGGDHVMLHAVLTSPNQVNWDDTMLVNLDPSIGEAEDEARLKDGTKIRLVGIEGKSHSGKPAQVPQVKLPMTVTAVYGEAQNQVQHSDHATDSEAVGMTKTLKSEPFAEELGTLHESLGKGQPEPNPVLEGGRGEGQPLAKGEDQMQQPKMNRASLRGAEDTELLARMVQLHDAAKDDERRWNPPSNPMGFIKEQFGRLETLERGLAQIPALAAAPKAMKWYDMGKQALHGANVSLYEQRNASACMGFLEQAVIFFHETLVQLGAMKRPVVSSAKPQRGQVYLLHFADADHYLGWAENVQDSIQRHYEGSGAKIAQDLGCRGTFTVARVWDDADEKFANKLQSQGKLARWCPICHSLGPKKAGKFSPFEQWVKAHPQFDRVVNGEYEHDPTGDSTTPEMLKERYLENTQWLSDLDFPLTIYRALEIEKNAKEFDINFDKMGIYWTWVENSADTYFRQDSIWNPGTRKPLKNPELVIVKALVTKPSDIDFEHTLKANMTDPEENEITLKPGAKLKLVGMDWGEGYKAPKKQHVITAAAADVEAAIAEIDATYPLSPLNQRENVVMQGNTPVAVVEVAERSGRLRLRGIRSIEQGKGGGSHALKEILAIADKHGVEVELTASPFGPEATRLDKDALQAWYRKHKFEDEPGYDPSLGYMVRRPKSAASAVDIDWENDMFEHFKLVPEFSWHEHGDRTDENEAIGEANWNMLIVNAFDTTNTQKKGQPGKWVGSAEFVLRHGQLESRNTEVDKNYWRQGIATAMYQYAEGFTGLKTVPHKTQSPAGRGLWQQKNRPFGGN